MYAGEVMLFVEKNIKFTTIKQKEIIRKLITVFVVIKGTKK